MKYLIVKVIEVSGMGKKIHKTGESVVKENFPEGEFDKLLKDGFLREPTKKEAENASGALKKEETEAKELTAKREKEVKADKEKDEERKKIQAQASKDAAEEAEKDALEAKKKAEKEEAAEDSEAKKDAEKKDSQTTKK